MSDFLATQLAACGPLDFVRLWIAGDTPGAYRMVVEAIRGEAGEGFDLSIGEEFAGSLPPSTGDGAAGVATRRFAEDDLDSVAPFLRALLDQVVPGGGRVSLTHGDRDELLRRRRLDAVVDAANAVLGAAAPPGAWSAKRQIPIQFQSGNVQLTVWPKDAPPHVLLEVWALVAVAVPTDDQVNGLIAECNEGFTYGRLLRQSDRLWYRDIIHAHPLSGPALLLSVQAAVGTATAYGPRFAELGATDGTAPEPTTPTTIERPPDNAVNPTGYL